MMSRNISTFACAAALAFGAAVTDADAAPFRAEATVFDVGYVAAGVAATGPVTITGWGDSASFGSYATLFGTFPGVALDAIAVTVGGASSGPIALGPGEGYALLDAGAVGLFVDIPGDMTALTDLIGNTGGGATPAGYGFDSAIALTAVEMQFSTAFFGVTLPVPFPSLGGAGLTITSFGTAITPTIQSGDGTFSVAIVPLPATLPLAAVAVAALGFASRRRIG